jgi:hypothetical protein
LAGIFSVATELLGKIFTILSARRLYKGRGFRKESREIYSALENDNQSRVERDIERQRKYQRPVSPQRILGERTSQQSTREES